MPCVFVPDYCKNKVLLSLKPSALMDKSNHAGKRQTNIEVKKGKEEEAMMSREYIVRIVFSYDAGCRTSI